MKWIKIKMMGEKIEIEITGWIKKEKSAESCEGSWLRPAPFARVKV